MISSTTRAVLAVVFALLCGACIHSAEKAMTQIRADALATVGEGRGESPGVVVATVRIAGAGDEDNGGETATIEVEAGGVAALADRRPVGPDTAFMWFSITKLFTATAIMQLHERGLLDIDAPVRDVLGDELAIDEPRGRPITARDLMSHSSGLANPSIWAAAAPAGQARRPLEAQLAELFERHGRRLRYRPGHGEGYSNLGYLALGRMIERADGRDYETYVREEILEVLDMDRTGFRWAPLLDDAAVGHARKGGFWTTVALSVVNPEVIGPSLPKWITTNDFEVEGAPYGGLIGTAGDLAKFLAAHLHQGRWRDRQLLSPASVKAMQSVQHDHRGRPLDYALGWHTQLIDGHRYFNHMGKGGGYRPAVRIWPHRRYGLVVLTNRTRYDPRPLTRSVPPPDEGTRSIGAGEALLAL